MFKTWKSWGPLAIALSVPFLAAAIGSVATESSVNTWYRRLKKPSWNPPRWIFAPVWSTLYVLMGLASWLVWRKHDASSFAWFKWFHQKNEQEVTGALRLYGVQLVLNALWSILFFGFRRLDWALAEVVVLWTMILTTLARFYRIDARAGWLLVPYQAWVTFATFLNFTVWRMNRKG